MKSPDQWADAAWEWFDPKEEIPWPYFAGAVDYVMDGVKVQVKDVVRKTVKLALAEFAAELKATGAGPITYKDAEEGDYVSHDNIDALLNGETSTGR